MLNILSHRWLATLAVLSAATPSLAAVDKAITWADMSSIDLKKVFETEYASNGNLYDPVVSDSMFDLVLKDVDSRISGEFKIPPDYWEDTRFWLKIYTEYSTKQTLIFDEIHHEIVYEVMDFRELSKKARNLMAYEIMRENRLKKRIAEYKAAFRSLQKNPNPKKPTDTQKRIIEARKKIRHSHTYGELLKNLRTQTGQRDNIMKGLIAAEMFFPKMERMFREVGVPVELTRLSLVESSFNLNAISRVGATGVWQFMHASALEYMTVNKALEIDERLSPLKSTAAAAKLLKRNRSILGSWDYAIISYNHGFKTLRKVIADRKRDKNRVGVYEGCVKNRPKLGWAGRNYYAEFLAVLHAESYRHLFYGETPHPPIKEVEFVKVNSKKSAIEVAKLEGIPIEEFRFLNPDIRNIRRSLPSGFWVLLPSDRKSIADAKQAAGRVGSNKDGSI